jgi:hypothetical protein
VIDQVMKDSSCHDPKMKAYCKEVRQLEDKFHDLELNHIMRRYNEAIDELVKIVSGRTTVPPDVFSRDLHEPSVDLRMTEGVDGPSLDPPPEAEAPSTRLTSCRWKSRHHQQTSSPIGVFRTSTVSFEGNSYRIRLRLDGWLAEPRPL